MRQSKTGDPRRGSRPSGSQRRRARQGSRDRGPHRAQRVPSEQSASEGWL